MKRRRVAKSDGNSVTGNDLVFGLHAIQAALEVPVTRVKEIWLADEREDSRIISLIKSAEKHNITPQKIAREELDEMVPDARHQGAIARCVPLGNLDETDLFKLLDALNESP